MYVLWIKRFFNFSKLFDVCKMLILFYLPQNKISTKFFTSYKQKNYKFHNTTKYIFTEIFKKHTKLMILSRILFAQSAHLILPQFFSVKRFEQKLRKRRS